MKIIKYEGNSKSESTAARVFNNFTITYRAVWKGNPAHWEFIFEDYLNKESK